MFVEEGEGVEKLVERNGLILHISDGKLSAGNQAGAKSKKKQNACDEEHLERRAWWNGYISRLAEGHGAPIDLDRDGWRWVFWKRCGHEMFYA